MAISVRGGKMMVDSVCGAFYNNFCVCREHGRIGIEFQCFVESKYRETALYRIMTERHLHQVKCLRPGENILAMQQKELDQGLVSNAYADFFFFFFSSNGIKSSMVTIYCSLLVVHQGFCFPFFPSLFSFLKQTHSLKVLTSRPRHSSEGDQGTQLVFYFRLFAMTRSAGRAV